MQLLKRSKKVCVRCNKKLAINKFYPEIRHKDGLISICKQCESKRGKKRRTSLKHRQYHKNYMQRWRKCTDKNYLDKRNSHAHNLWVKYKMTVKEFNLKLKSQKNKCAICCGSFKGKICVDHNHKTKAIRGLLCHHCNSGLGMFKDSIKILDRAKQYLKRNG